MGDGYVQVKAGAQVIVHENLWEERGRAIFRRKVPRVVTASSEVLPGDTEIDIWIVVPSMNFNNHRTVSHRFQPGASNRLVIVFDAKGRKVDVSIN